MSLDQSPLLNRNNRQLFLNQQDFIREFNELGRIMISAPDLYEAGKTADPETLASLRKDFVDTWIITSTRFHYEPSSLEGTITHYFGSTVVEPREQLLIIPIYSEATLDQVLAEDQGLIFLQTLFGTGDDGDEIKTTLHRLSNKVSHNTKIWTLDQNSRRNLSDLAAGFGYYGGVFQVLGSNYMGDLGRSRGVDGSAVGTRCKKELPSETAFDFNSGINKKNRCVYFSSVQDIGNLTRYAGLFCFHERRFVISLTTRSNNPEDLNTRISSVLAQRNSSHEKLSQLYQEFSPLYAHLLKYEPRQDKFTLIDDIEAFGRQVNS